MDGQFCETLSSQFGAGSSRCAVDLCPATGWEDIAPHPENLLLSKLPELSQLPLAKGLEQSGSSAYSLESQSAQYLRNHWLVEVILLGRAEISSGLSFWGVLFESSLKLVSYLRGVAESIVCKFKRSSAWKTKWYILMSLYRNVSWNASIRVRLWLDLVKCKFKWILQSELWPIKLEEISTLAWKWSKGKIMFVFSSLWADFLYIFSCSF